MESPLHANINAAAVHKSVNETIYLERGISPIGQSRGLVHEVLPAAQIVANVLRQAEAVRASLGTPHAVREVRAVAG